MHTSEKELLRQVALTLGLLHVRLASCLVAGSYTLFRLMKQQRATSTSDKPPFTTQWCSSPNLSCPVMCCRAGQGEAPRPMEGDPSSAVQPQQPGRVPGSV